MVVLDLPPTPDSLDLLDEASGGFSMLRRHESIEPQVVTGDHPCQWVIRG